MASPQLRVPTEDISAFTLQKPSRPNLATLFLLLTLVNNLPLPEMPVPLVFSTKVATFFLCFFG